MTDWVILYGLRRRFLANLLVMRVCRTVVQRDEGGQLVSDVELHDGEHHVSVENVKQLGLVTGGREDQLAMLDVLELDEVEPDLGAVQPGRVRLATDFPVILSSAAPP